MIIALYLLTIQGFIGAFDTVYYHEWKARLPARGPQSAPELRLHAFRDFLYGILFGLLPWMAFHGAWAVCLAGVLLAEIALTLTDFVVEKRVRKPFGDVYAGERVTHAVMGILYGAMTANLLPVLADWWNQPTQLLHAPAAAPEALRWTMTVMAVGVVVSGLRDLYASLGLPGGHWPWKTTPSPANGTLS